MVGKCLGPRVRPSFVHKLSGRIYSGLGRDEAGRFAAASAPVAVVVVHTRQQKRYEARQAAKKGGAHV